MVSAVGYESLTVFGFNSSGDLVAAGYAKVIAHDLKEMAV